MNVHCMPHTQSHTILQHQNPYTRITERRHMLVKSVNEPPGQGHSGQNNTLHRFVCQRQCPMRLLSLDGLSRQTACYSGTWEAGDRCWGHGSLCRDEGLRCSSLRDMHRGTSSARRQTDRALYPSSTLFTVCDTSPRTQVPPFLPTLTCFSHHQDTMHTYTHRIKKTNKQRHVRLSSSHAQ